MYFVQAGGPTGPVKIGRSRDFAKRLSMLQTGNPEPLTPLALLAVPRADADDFEWLLHDTLADLRLRGEWFAFDQRIADIVEDVNRWNNLFATVHRQPLVLGHWPSQWDVHRRSS